MLRFAVSAIVVDIEGTVGPISFVRDVLFPYAQEHIADYVARHRDDPEVVQALHDTTLEAGEPGVPEARVIEILREWMRADRKATPLKTLQGLLWADGYAHSGLRATIYADAARALRAWHAQGIPLYVYSSGSVLAQKLYFANTSEGDLLACFADYFDTTIGAKTMQQSYRTICERIGQQPEWVLYLADREGEVDAAAAAGCRVATLLRPLDVAPGTASAYPAVTTLADIEVGLRK